MTEKIQKRINEEDFNDFLNELLRNKMLEDTSAGIAKQFIDRGIDTLSDKQMHVLEKFIIDPHYVEECSEAGCDIPWSEMLFAKDNKGMCSWCYNRINKKD